MQSLLAVFSLLLVLPLAVHCQDDDRQCTIPRGKESCVCDTGDGIIDLTSISSSSGHPYFSVYVPSGAQYYYNPCRTFNLEGFDVCSGDVGVCQMHQGGSYVANCGKSSTEKIVKQGDGHYYVIYDGGTDGSTTAEIPTFSPDEDNDPQSLISKFDLTTKCACPGLCKH